MAKRIIQSAMGHMENGEKIRIAIEYRSIQKRRYIMELIDEDYTWIKKFRQNEIILLKIFADRMDSDNMVAISSLFKKEVMRIFNIKPNKYYQLIKSMVDKDAIIKLSSSDIMVNPRYYVKRDIRKLDEVERLYRDNKPYIDIKLKENGSNEFE